MKGGRGFLLYEGVKGDTLERGTSMMTHDKVVLWPRSAESVRTTSLVPRLCPTGLCGFALVISYYTIAACSALYAVTGCIKRDNFRCRNIAISYKELSLIDKKIKIFMIKA